LNYQEEGSRALRRQKRFPSSHDVTRATLIAQLIYAAPAWWGFVSLAERDRIQSVIRKAQRYGYLPRNFPDFSSLVDALETNLFNSIAYCITQTMFSTN